jgi:hypothetical protein
MGRKTAVALVTHECDPTHKIADSLGHSIEFAGLKFCGALDIDVATESQRVGILL